jgi:O-acetylhomoserine (thiol)-lyase
VGYRFHTKLLHGDGSGKYEKNATLPPIYQSNAFGAATAEELEKIFQNKAPGFAYSRLNNPTVDYFERRITLLEGGMASVACSSGMAAVFNAIVNVLEEGDEVLSSAGIFGGTIGLFQDLKELGIETRYVETLDAASIHKNVTEKTKLIFGEVIGNPKLDVLDIEEAAKAAHEHGILFVVDNTVSTPYLVQPLSLGADIVVQSSSKYINGSSNAISGIITVGKKFGWEIEKYPQMGEYKKMGAMGYVVKLRNTLFRNTGACLAPVSAYLNYLGLETLGIRMERICQNAEKLAQWLQSQPEIKKVEYPGLLDGIGHASGEKQFDGGYGGMITIRMGTKQKAFAFLNALEIPLLVSNIGDTKTLVIHPESTIYIHSTEEEKKHAGVYDDLIRISVGIEDVEDIIEDFAQALDKIKGGEE